MENPGAVGTNQGEPSSRRQGLTNVDRLGRDTGAPVNRGA